MPKVTEPVVKPGWKTTEFWTKMVPQVLGILALLGIVDIESAQNMGAGFQSILAGAMITVPEISYSFARGIAKHGAPTAEFDRESYIQNFWNLTRRQRRQLTKKDENTTETN